MLKKLPQSQLPILCPNEECDDAPDRLRLSDLSESAVKPLKTALGQLVIVLLSNGRPRAFDARCPHMGSNLVTAACVGGDIVCHWHGYRFSGESGALVANPNEAIMKTLRVPSVAFDPTIKPSYQLRERALEVEDGWVRVK